MIGLKTVEDIRKLKSDMHSTFDSPQGQEVLRFLEISCGWYQSVLSPDLPDNTLINDGKRQVLATIKTFLEFSPEQIHAIIRQGEL